MMYGKLLHRQVPSSMGWRWEVVMVNDTFLCQTVCKTGSHTQNFKQKIQVSISTKLQVAPT